MVRRFPQFCCVSGGILGFLGVVMGVLAAHGLQGSLNPRAIDWIEIGSRYQLYHALALLALTGLSLRFERSSRWLVLASLAFLVGVVLFSGSLFAMALTGLQGFATLTPLGGLCFLVGWLALAAYGVSLCSVSRL